jgi:hypothetical protein
MPNRPRLNDRVCYVSLGSARGEYPSRCLAADVIETYPDEPTTVGLYIKTLWSTEKRPLVHHDEGVDITPSGFGPSDYCDGKDHAPGTWHWSS